ncbi:hypothetical protein A2U01_0072271, partial [Trifolium medium]|nr:hypothetical protein [Trifolium medium]
AKREGMSKSS